VVEVRIPEPENTDILPEDIPLNIVYEDSDVIVVNKPSGMIVHPSAGIYSGTLVNALLAHCDDLSGINGVTRPGIVHRIDKETSGLLMAAKNDIRPQEPVKPARSAHCHPALYRPRARGHPAHARPHRSADCP